MSVLNCITQFMVSNSHHELTIYCARKFAQKLVLLRLRPTLCPFFTLFLTNDEFLTIMLVKNNVKKGHKVPENFDLNELNDQLTVEIPLRARVYPHVDM